MNKSSNSTVILIAYQAIYVFVMLWLMPMLNLGETFNAAMTAILTVTSAILIGRSFIDERERGSLRRSMGTLSLCALITVYVLYQCGLYS